MLAFNVTLSPCHERHSPRTAAHTTTATPVSEQCEDYRHVPLPPRMEQMTRMPSAFLL